MLRKTVLARALFLAFSTAALTTAVVEPAMAQSNAAGTLYGVVAPGAQVTAKNVETNLTRSATADAAGRFQITALPIGRYTVTAGSQTANVEVLAGQGVEALFAAAGVQQVQVTGRRSRIDVSNASNGVTFTARELAKLPVAQNVQGIILLAPNTVKGDSRYAAGDSFGGGGPSENAYYINGFPVTNPLTQLGASELPFGAVAQAQILTGGFGAEFGRSIGGVVNITTKSGTNNWEAGAMYYVEPNAWRSTPKSSYYPTTGKSYNSVTDGKARVYRENNTNDGRRFGAYVGGPLIKDKLFMFLSFETTNTDQEFLGTAFTANASNKDGWVNQKAVQDRYLSKFDWNITDDHRLELTMVGDNAKADRKLYGYNYTTNTHDNNLALSGHFSNDSTANGFTPSSGGDFWNLRYVGNLTDNLTLTVAHGQSTVKHENTFDTSTSVLLPSTAIASGGNPNPATPINNPNPVTFRILPPGAGDKVKASRLDLEYKLGTHTIRGGLDQVKLKSINAGQITAGTATWTYRFTSTPTTPITMGSGPKVATASGGGLGTQGFYVQKAVFDTSTSAASDQDAQYLEDKWQVTKNFLFTAGIRREGFSNRNGDDQTFLEQKNQISPRLSAAWDVNGDASFKVFGSAGRYVVQIPTNVTVRGASRATNTSQYYTYTGIDANGQPLGLTKLTDPRSANNEYGQAKDPRTITSTNLKPSYQDEITFGFEKAYSPDLNFGAKATYRKLRATSDDFCDQTPFDDWAARNHVDESKFTYGIGCVILNPGMDQDFLVDFNNGDPALAGKNLTKVHLTASEIGLPEAKRIYTAVDLFAEHPLRNGWYGKVNYTWSKSHGNTEGQTNSDTGQANVSITAVWDQKYIMEGADGPLPNNRDHVLKAFGFYQVTPEWTVGGNMLAATGRPRNCLGNHPDPAVQDLGYGASYHYCFGKLVPRGATGNYPPDVRFDANVAYSPEFLKGFQVKLDVFNLFNRQAPSAIQDVVENADGTMLNNAQGVLSYTAPRSARLTLQYDHKF
ncbi:TonB-dependent receptor [Massilia arenosa]|uniref:TonB-dependent receptor n=1 Tax=Zemynaea arenosa TaxID=2561931 RepID=A0A4Y9SH23_9BURK|nr:carboxypeptidase regulatory-like domain-containing protein [Massilia arenosa]TFW20908.1 TonB-dependent receptor [Massilia arenosa]